MNSSGLSPWIRSQNQTPRFGIWPCQAVHLLPTLDGHYFTWLRVLMDSRFTMDMPGLSLLSAGVRATPKTFTGSICQALLFSICFSSPLPSICWTFSLPAGGADDDHGRAGLPWSLMDGGESQAGIRVALPHSAPESPPSGWESPALSLQACFWAWFGQ